MSKEITQKSLQKAVDKFFSKYRKEKTPIREILAETSAIVQAVRKHFFVIREQYTVKLQNKTVTKKDIEKHIYELINFYKFAYLTSESLKEDMVHLRFELKQQKIDFRQFGDNFIIVREEMTDEEFLKFLSKKSNWKKEFTIRNYMC